MPSLCVHSARGFVGTRIGLVERSEKVCLLLGPARFISSRFRARLRALMRWWGSRWCAHLMRALIWRCDDRGYIGARLVYM